MKPAYSVLFLTTLLGAGQGLFLALYGVEVAVWAGRVPPQDPVVFFGAGGAVVLGLLGLGIVASVFFLTYRYLGLIDTLLGLVIIYLTCNLSLVIWMMRTFFDGVPRSLEEAAEIDGARPWVAFLRITLPLAGPGLATTAIFCFLFAWNDFFFALVLTRSQAQMAPVAIVNFLNYEGWEWGRSRRAGR